MDTESSAKYYQVEFASWLPGMQIRVTKRSKTSDPYGEEDVELGQGVLQVTYTGLQHEVSLHWADWLTRLWGHTHTRHAVTL